MAEFLGMHLYQILPFNLMNRSLLLALFLFGFAHLCFGRPNVILILTDDQGIGDLGAHGNPWLKTPNLDTFYQDSIRMTDFHVSPVCTPTRGALMTGRYPINNGAWATYKGRDALSEENLTLAEIFQKNGYTTGLFGKWHLGDNYPVRPTDCGFDVSINHKAGGVGELSDYWGNTYFDDTYFVNNEPQQFEGYCTDIWFEEAIKFIDDNKDKPFFAYIPTNAPHGPLYVEEKYAAPYKQLAKDGKIVSAEFFGMIVNIDENFGKLEAYLKKSGLADNTILIFMTDNGSGNGFNPTMKVGYNQGLSGKKGSRYDGGHRVPFFIRWKDGKVDGGWDINEVTSHVDLIPTLAGLCDLKVPRKTQFDGVDFSPLLLKEKKALKERTVFVHSRQDWRPPMDESETCIIRGKWRLVNGTELYDSEQDRAQENDIAQKHPEIVKALLADNAKFLKASKSNPEYKEFPVSVIGHKAQNEVKLTVQHAIGEDRGYWKCEQVSAGLKSLNNKHSLRVARAGRYRIECMRWPKECSGPILGIPSKNPKNWFTYETISPEKVRIEIANQVIESTIGPDDHTAVFVVNLEPGKTILTNDFIDGDDKYGVYYTYITYLGK